MGDFKALLRKFCLESTILGLKYFYLYPDKLSRCFWTATLVFLLYTACLLTTLLYNRFLEMPTRISIENQYEPVNNLSFPAITICSPNQITISALKHFNLTLVDGNRSINLENIVPQLLGFYELVADVNKDGLESFQNLITLNRYNPLEVMGIMPQGCDDFIRECYWREKRFPCGDHFNPILTKHGMCCIFNSVYYYKKNKRYVCESSSWAYFSRAAISISTIQTGFLLKASAFLSRDPACVQFHNRILLGAEPSEQHMELIISVDSDRLDLHWNERKHNFVPFKMTKMVGSISKTLTVVTDYNPDDALYGTVLTAGATRVMFTEWTEFPADDESSLIHPNSESLHAIHSTYTYCSKDVTSLPSWSRKCYFEDERTLPHFRNYHNSDCDLVCHVRELERLCHCTMIYVPNVRLSNACNITSINCIVEAKMQINKWYRPEQCDCLRDCVSLRYRIELNVGNLDALPHLMYNPYTGIKFNKSTSIFHFIMPHPVYVKQKQETVISLISLSSNLGGIFGLCLGCSVISVLEIVFYLYLVIKNKIQQILQGRCNNRIDYLP